jgi:branched-subunit amino acid aminotransferase/4-amino-4-deoxychorismate lyase
MIKAREISLKLDDLARADAVFLSNSLSLLSVSEIEERAFEDITPFLAGLPLFEV